ncbi:MAG: MFS transporter [Chloroflexia bacterium]|nr:MFS transporter [Chloroflexia bacterium]
MVRFLQRRQSAPGLPSLQSIGRRLRLPTTGLWLNRDFMNLWGAETVSQFGSQITPVAIPLLAALTLDATPFQMGLLATTGGLPVLLFGFIAGAWVDRLRRKPIMMAADIGRAIVLLAIPLAALFDVLSIPLLMAVSLLVGAQTVMFNAAYVSILPTLVDRVQLADANGKLYSSMSLAQVAGPALAGSLVAWITAPVVILIDSITFLWSGLFIKRIRHDERADFERPVERHFWREVREGLHALFSSPVLRATTLSTATINLAGYMFLSVYVLYMTNELGLSATGVGFVYASGGVGALIGSVIAPRLAKRFGVGHTLVWAAVAQGAFGVTVPLAIVVPDYALPLVVFAEFMQWLWLVVFFINVLSLRQSITPNRLQGRVAASNQVLTGGMALVGSFLGGTIGSVFSVQASLIAGIVGMFLAAFWVLFSPAIHIREMPTEPDAALDG